MFESTTKSVKNRWIQFWLKLPIAYRGAAILAIPVIAMIPAIASWTWSRQAKTDAYWWIDHTQEVIRESSSLMRTLVDAETAIRGYAITQQNEFLESYNQANAEIPLYFDEIKKLTKDNPQQQQQLLIIEQRIEARIGLLEDVLNNIEPTSNIQEDSQLMQLFINGKTEMEDIRNAVELFKNEEWILLNVRQQHLKRIARTTNILLAITMGLSLLGYMVAIELYYCAETKLEEKLKELDLNNQTLSATNQLVKERNAELDRFAYVVSHDLKAPLRAISNLSEWIEEDLSEKLDEDSSHNMTLLRNRVQRMNNFIDGLLEYSRVGKVTGEQSEIDVRKLLLEIIDSIAPPPQFVIVVEDPIPVLKTESLALQQVFGNLIGNAIKHHHRDDGKIVISAQKKSEYYQFCVADDGVGIAAEHQEKIFVIFQTLAAKDTKENTGVGLSIVKKIVENNGGQIWLESEPNKGTKFYFTWNSY